QARHRPKTRISFQEVRMATTPARMLAGCTTDRFLRRAAEMLEPGIAPDTEWPEVRADRPREPMSPPWVFAPRRARAGWGRAGAGRLGAGGGGFRTITTSSMSGSSSVPTMRSVERNLIESLLIGSMTWVDDVARPSPEAPHALTIQASPERVHCPWPKSPSES